MFNDPFWNQLLPLIIPVVVVLGFALICGLAAIMIRIIGPWMNLEQIPFRSAIRLAALSFLASIALHMMLAFYTGYLDGLTRFNVPNPGRSSTGMSERQIVQMAGSSPMAGLLSGAAGLAVASLIATRFVPDLQSGSAERLSVPHALAFTCAYFTATSMSLGVILWTVVGLITLLF